MTVDEIINFVIDVFEGDGTYTDAPGDAGGATRWGVTRPFRARAIGRPVSKLDIRNLTRAQAIDTYHLALIEPARLDQIFRIDWGVFFVVYDFAVNAGADDAVPAMQRAIGVKPDGVIGPATLAALEEQVDMNELRVVLRILMERQQFHIDRSYRPNQAQWLRGWLRRCTALGATVAGKAPTSARASIKALSMPTAASTRGAFIPGSTVPRFGYFSNARDCVIQQRRSTRVA